MIYIITLRDFSYFLTFFLFIVLIRCNECNCILISQNDNVISVKFYDGIPQITLADFFV